MPSIRGRVDLTFREYEKLVNEQSEGVSAEYVRENATGSYSYKYDFEAMRYRVYNPEGRLIHIHREEWRAEEVVTRKNKKLEETNMGEPTDESSKVYPVSAGGFSTRTIQTSKGVVGQIVASTDLVAWDSEPTEDKDGALTAANDKLKEKLVALFA